MLDLFQDDLRYVFRFPTHIIHEVVLAFLPFSHSRTPFPTFAWHRSTLTSGGLPFAFLSRALNKKW
jgi:hypothetical protein